MQNKTTDSIQEQLEATMAFGCWKYKGISIQDNRWVLGDLLRQWDGIYIRETWGTNDTYKVDPDTVCIYSGLQDIHNVETFTEDIISCVDKSNNEIARGTIKFGIIPTTQHIGFYVKWNSCDSLAKNTISDWRCDLGYWLRDERCKIIGNTYDSNIVN